MKSRTLVCVYGKGSDVEEVFERLDAIFRLNYSDSYVYCALIDMETASLYRVAGDSDIESKAQLAVERLCKAYGEHFFCGIRQRRCDDVHGERLYCCEGGAVGALKAIWRYAGGRKDELFPCFGELRGGFDRVYFSESVYAQKNGIRICGCDRTVMATGDLIGKTVNRVYGFDRTDCELSKNSGKAYETVEVIEAGGIFKLGAELGKSGGVRIKSGTVRLEGESWGKKLSGLRLKDESGEKKIGGLRLVGGAGGKKIGGLRLVGGVGYKKSGNVRSTDRSECDGTVGDVLFTSLALDALLSSGVSVGDLVREPKENVGFCSILRRREENSGHSKQ